MMIIVIIDNSKIKQNHNIACGFLIDEVSALDAQFNQSEHTIQRK